MNRATARIIKESRALFWPWCAVVLAGVLQWLPFGPGYSPRDYAYGFWAGLPLLAALSMGNEFQYRTMGLLLSQPIDRKKIWFEKWTVLFGAAIMASSAYWVMWQMLDSEAGPPFVPLLWMITATCSAAFWTLVTRSTIGGMVFTLLQGFVFVVLANVVIWKLGPEPPAATVRALTAAGTAAALGYAALMFWLGRRKFVRFEAIGEIASADSFVVSPDMTRGAFARILRCRPSGTVLNLVRKEVRMLWPVWLLIGTSIIVTGGISALQLLPGMPVDRLAVIVAIGVVGFNLLSMVLAGTLSMAEERTLGTQSWHLTLPVAAGLQWLIKLGVALFAGFAGLALPILVAQSALGIAFSSLYPAAWMQLPFSLVVSSAISFTAFWCACAVKGTVRAALCVFPALGLVLYAFRAGYWAAQWLVRSDLLESTLLRFHPFGPAARSIVDLTIGRYIVLWIFIPPLALGLIQTWRLFRQEITDSILSAFRYLLPVAAVAFFFGFASLLPVLVIHSAGSAVYRTIDEIHAEVGKLQTTITIRPKEGDNWLEIHKQQSDYFPTIRFRNDWECTAFSGPYFRCKTLTGDSLGISRP